MMKRKIRLKIWLGITFILFHSIGHCKSDRNCNSTKTESAIGRNAFSPRMDFNQWKPLGRGDPLKNDPTYDYVPPVLEQVHYWVEPALRKPDPPLPEDSKKTEILLLGVLSKKSASGPTKADSRRDNFDPYQKKDQKYNPHQRISKPTFSLPSSFFPESLFSTLSKFSSKNENKPTMPYTVLMPPPMNLNMPPSKSNLIQPSIPLNIPDLKSQYTPLSHSFTTPSTTTTTSFVPSASSHVTIQPSHLVYHSSSLSDENEWKNKNQYATVASSVSWRPPSTIKPYMPTTNKVTPGFRENLVFNKHLQPPESFIHIEFAPRNYSNNQLIGADSNYNLNFVTPPALANADKLHKGSISDNSAEIKNAYVKIEKPEFYSTGLSSDDYVSINTAPLIEIYSHMQHPVVEKEMETIKKMQTLLPPPTTDRPIYKEVASNPILNALIKEKYKTTMKQPTYLTHTPTFIISSTTSPTTTTTSTTTIHPVATETTEPSTIYVTETEQTPEPTTTTTTSTTTPSPLTTTDSFLKYYKQPEESLKSPVYFVIQGHSKVKTYGPTKQVHGISVQETNEILDDESSQYKVRHLHGFKNDQPEEKTRLGRSGNLQTLKHVIQTGLGSIDLSMDEFNSHRRKDVQETELQFGYNVAEEGEVTSEIYHKGIVEEARKLKI